MKNLILIIFAFGFLADKNLPVEEYNKLSEKEKRTPEHAIDGLDLLDPELEISLFASEPMMSSPTNMDIDDKGRVWICEAFNYRNKLNPKNPYRPAGDRILIMEDTNGDGKADNQKVFYQGNDINAALGIAVLGNKIYVSCSPNLLVFTDTNGDDIPDKKEIILSGIGGIQHDHGMHAVVFGPDGDLYFNFGNNGEKIINKYGKPLTDDMGRLVKDGNLPYREGMIFRTDEDFNNIETLGWNFRNNYELALDSYGRIWQSDNDDDGNRSTRINFVMPHGNYGYKDEISGADWRVKRTNLEDSVYQKHWHLNDPGVVPNLLQTYAGSPTGIIVYEGNQLPPKYQNQIIHCDAGPNIVRAYPTQKVNSGFSASIIPILDGSKKDKWFRPSDVCTAPDGSIFVADWYDPGVGGHAMGDSTRGRIYRISKKNTPYKTPKYDYKTISDAVNALKNPNQAVRYLAFKAIEGKGLDAEKQLKDLILENNPVFAARAYWLLAKINTYYIEHASESENEDIRLLSIKMADKYFNNSHDFMLKMAEDASPQIKREVALALYHKKYQDVWVKLANDYKGNDRWYLEALGISAADDWDSHLDLYLANKNFTFDNAAKEIIWRSRAKQTAKLLGEIIKKENGSNKNKYYRAFDFQKGAEKEIILVDLLKSTNDTDEKLIIFSHLNEKSINSNPVIKSELIRFLAEVKNDDDYLMLVSKYKVKSEFDRVHKIVLEKSAKESVESEVKIFGIIGLKKELAKNKNVDKILSIYGKSDDALVNNFLSEYVKNTKNSILNRKAAMLALSGYNGEEVLFSLLKAKQIPNDFKADAYQILSRTWHSDIRYEIKKILEKEEIKIKVNVDEILALKLNVEKGKASFSTFCSSCHVVGNSGVNFGPNLSQIGSKLSNIAILNAILNPSEGISFGYEGFEFAMKDGSKTIGMLTSTTENDYIIKVLGQEKETYLKRNLVQKVTKQEESLMPKYSLEKQELKNLTAYLETLK